MSWRKVKLGELGEFRNGLNYSKANEGSGLKVISVKDFGDLRVPNFEELDEINPSGLNIRNSLLAAGDIIFVRSNGNKDLIGRSMFIEKAQENVSFSGFCIRFRNQSDFAHSKFLAYYFRSPLFRRTLSNLGGGTNINNLNQGVLGNFPISLPSIGQQETILHTLSAYDDLIENNRRRIGLLEQAARLLYREWFVHLRFPGHETTKIVDGLPEGWVLRRVTDICTVARGASPRPIQNFLDGTVPWFKIGDATASESPFVFDTKEKIIEEGVKRSVFLPAGEMILSNSATCGVPNFTAVDGCIHDGWLYFKDLRHISKEHLFLFFESKQREMLQGIGEGAVQKNFNTEYVGRQVLPLPQGPALIAEFSDRVQPMFAQIKAFATHNRALTRARDLLLPRLMNGRIPV